MLLRRLLGRDRPEPEGARARRLAEEALNRTRAETPMYRALGDSLRELRENNGFAENIRTSMGVHPK